MQALLTLLATFSYGELLLFIVIIYFLYILYLKFTDNDYYTELQDIKSKYNARMWEYLSGELRIIEATSLNNAEKLLGIEAGKDISEEVNRQFAMFGLVVERTVHHILFESIKTAIRVNGFMSMTPEDLDAYVHDKADVLLRESRKSLNGRVSYYPLLRGTDDQRFTLDDAYKVYYKIVKKCIKLHNEEKLAIKKLKRKYSLWAKINLLGIIIDKLKKSK